MDEERVLQVWSYRENHFAGRLLYGTVERRRYDGCLSVENVSTLARALGERVDRIELLDQPIPWPHIESTGRSVNSSAVEPEQFEQNLIKYLLRMNTGQRKRLAMQITALPLDDRVQFVEHCNDLAAAAARTMLEKSRSN